MMKRILIATIISLALSISAWAGWNGSPESGGFAVYAPSGGGGGPLTFTPTATATAWQTSVSPPAIFSAVSIGTASSDRIVVVGVDIDGNATNGVVSGVTIGGTSATQAVKVDPGAAGQGAYIFYLKVPTGTTANIVVSCNGFPGGVGIWVGKITGSATAALSATNTVGPSAVADPHSITTTVPSNGVGVVGVLVDRATTPTWSSATGDTNVTEPSGNTMAMLSAHTTSNSPSFTGANNFNLTMVAATFGP